MRLSIDGIALFFRENWQFLLSMMPVVVILFLLFRKLFQLAKADLKGVIGAFLAVFGVLAALVVPGLFIDPDLWGKIMYLIILGAFFVFFLINDPKGVLKTVLITLAACAFVIAVGLIFGFGAAAAVAANGFFCIFRIILIAASRIRMPTAIRIPRKAWAIHVISRKLSRNMEIRKMMQKDGRIIPTVAAIAPASPFCL